MTTSNVEHVANEDRDAAFISVGALRAAVQIMESADPKDRAAREMWRAALSLAQKAMLQEWAVAEQMSPVEAPK